MGWKLRKALLAGVLAMATSVPCPGRLAAERDDREAAQETGADRNSELWASVGLRYNRNLSVDPDRIPRSSSPLLDTGLYGYDDRTLWKRRLRSLGYVEIATDLEDSNRDFQIVSGMTGPVFPFAKNWDLHVGLGGWVSFFGYELYSVLGAAYLTWENRQAALLRQVELDVGVEHFGSGFGGDDIPWADLLVTFGFDSILGGGDWMGLTPFFEHYHADEPLFRYSQVAGIVEYGRGLVGRLELSTVLMGWRRIYYGSEFDVEGDRRDWFLNARVSLLYPQLLVEPLSLELRGVYEQNWSNDDFEDYEGESVALFLHWQFWAGRAPGITRRRSVPVGDP